MANKNIHGIIGVSLLVLSPVTWSAPPLTMHIFDKKDQKESINQVAQPPLLEMHLFKQSKKKEVVNHIAQAPLLKVHLFDNSPTMQNNAVLAERYTRAKPHEQEELALSYIKAESYIAMGYRRDDLDWSIAGPDGTPNILSELTWKDIEIATISAGTTLLFESNWLINVNLLFGSIYNGKNQDSDYLGDNRTFEFSRSNNSGDKGSVLDISASTGYNWTVPLNEQSTYPNIDFRPQIGLSYYSQNLKVTDGNQTVSIPIPALDITLPSTGPFPGLHSSYDATWFGPWVGLKSRLNFTESFSLSASLEYHYAKYDSTANWNLRNDFSHPKSFTQKAVGYGLIGDVKGEYQLSAQLAFILSIKYQDWQAHKQGVDTTFLADDTVLTTQYNGVNWYSLGANVGFVYSF
ncbi:MAG: hypothetical protein COA59_11670 [Colwellia sp.]|nr:MAG: hypothetical protein COA59_11670 [Colwellia sp.]